VQGEQKFTSATSKPAPFAEKKSAKDAAPENSMSGLIGLRCDAGGFATRPDFSAQATGYAGGPYTNIECRKPQWQNTASAASTDRNGQRQRSGGGGDGGAVPFATACAMHFSVGSWSIDGDTGSGRCSFDLLHGSSDADEIEHGRPELEIEATLIGFVIGGDRVRFLYGEDV
jgi:hypothetical protein